MPIQWPSEFAFGISEIDETHQEMFVRINQLVEACEKGRGVDQLESLLQFFQQELISHFETEEALMQACNYPERQRHKRSHSDFVRHVRTLQQEIESTEECNDALGAFNEALIGWLFDHVCMEDRALSDYIRAPR